MALCSTPESLGVAIQALSNQTHIFLDCEGQTLGEVGGKLSLLNLGVTPVNSPFRLQTFLIDVLAFQGEKSSHLVPIFDILRSERTFKVVFDGRMDASELLHGHGVRLRNVLDLQVADMASREKRRESVDQSLQRLVGFLPQNEVTRNRLLYLQVQKLNGLESALREYSIPGGSKGHVDHSRWLQRPLQQDSLQYAAADIQKICQLYYKFVEKGYITTSVLVQQSARYLALHSNSRPRGSDKYKRHGLFPLAILSETTAGASTRCQGCERVLPVTAFTPPGSLGHSNGFCFVCRAVDAKAGSSSNTYTSFGGRTVNYEDLYDDDMFDDVYEDPDDVGDFGNDWEVYLYDDDYYGW